MFVPTICIPRLPQPQKWQTIKSSFEKIIGEGTVNRVNIVQKKNEYGDMYQCVFIHFRRWSNNPNAAMIRDRLQAGKFVNVVYDEASPWFWRCTLSRTR